MTWIKLDDNAVDHPKVESLSDRAFRWWIRGLSYASRFLTDGVLPPVFWKKVPANDRKELTGNKLWDYVDPDMHIHDYLTHQSSKDDVQAEKQRNREKVAAYRERRQAERRKDVTGNGNQPVTGNTPPAGNRLVTDPENREQIQRTDTENREQNKNVPPPPLRPLVSGESNPKNWGKIHGDHVAGFCDWVCLPDFIFGEFVRKSSGAEYVKGWAAAVRSKHQGGVVGDNLKFWRNRWSESHPEAAPATNGKPRLRTPEEIKRSMGLIQ